MIFIMSYILIVLRRSDKGKQVVTSCIPQPLPLQQLHREWWRWVQRPPVSCTPERSCEDSIHFPMGRLGKGSIGQVTVTPVSPGICGKVVPSASMQSR